MVMALQFASRPSERSQCIVETLEADVAVVGSGIAGALCAYFLAKRGLRVIVLEAGPRITRAGIVEGFRTSYEVDLSAGYPNTDLAPRPNAGDPRDDFLVQDGPLPFKVEFLKLVGGTTWHWAGGATRMYPADFRLHSIYGQGCDWPISYDDLEPYYAQAEVELGVSGAFAPGQGPPRSTPFPMTPSPLNAQAKWITDRLAPHGIHFNPFIAARATRSYDGRSKCLGYNSCMPICPTGANYNAIVHVEKAEAAGARVLENALVTRLSADARTQSMTGLDVRRADGSPLRVTARHYVLAANGLENAKLLLMSSHEHAPAGLANSSDQVGRNLMDHPGFTTTMLGSGPTYPGRGPAYLVSCWQHVDTPERKHSAGFRLNLANSVNLHKMARDLIMAGHTAKSADTEIRRRATHLIAFDTALEALPAPGNRVTLDATKLDRSGLPKMRIRYELGGYERSGVEAAKTVLRRIAVILGATGLEFSDVFMHSHLMGTTRMGDDARTSVADNECRTHDIANLHIAGSSLFPASACGHPTLSIAALSIRLAASIARQLT